MILLDKYLPTLEERAYFGEMFGVTHSLFEGLGFAALIFTILIQQREIKDHRKETNKSVLIQKSLVEVLSITAQLNAQYSLLDSKNREHDRSLALKVPKTTSDEEDKEIKKVELKISNSVDTLIEIRSDLKKLEAEILPIE